MRTVLLIIAVVFVLAFSLGGRTPCWGFQTGQTGQPGTPGVNGDPGTDGGNGQVGGNLDRIVVGDGNYRETATGGTGGRGGHAGNGIDGSDADDFALGGQGGNGNTGGSGLIRWNGLVHEGMPWQIAIEEVRVNAAGGDGGAGGRAGIPDNTTTISLAGTGGTGGVGIAWGRSTRFVESIAIGGRGGNAAAGVGGVGGSARGSAIVRSQTNAGEIVLTLEGGIGGKGNGWFEGPGIPGGTGGQGGSVNLDGVGSQFIINSPLGGTFRLKGNGGNGGDSFDGPAGIGGNASMNYSHFNLSYLPPGSGFDPSPEFKRNVFVDLKGGTGGTSTGVVAPGITGARGGWAVIQNDQPMNVYGPSDKHYITVTGGKGGTGNAWNSPGRGGDGGQAWIKPMEIDHFGTNAEAGSSLYYAKIIGGNGGSSMGPFASQSAGGDGATVTSKNTIHVRMHDHASALVIVESIGGLGGNLAKGGNAYTTLIDPFDRVGALDATVPTYELRAIATGGGSVSNMGRTGDATSIAEQTGLARILVTASANSGFIQDGIQGNSRSIARGTSILDGDGGETVVNATAGPSIYAQGGRPRIGGNATADSFARTSGLNSYRAESNATATGIPTTQSSGNAFARARSEKTGGLSAMDYGFSNPASLANAHSLVRGSGDYSSRPWAISNAVAEADVGLAYSFAESSGLGSFTSAYSTARSTGTHGFTRSIARAAGGPLPGGVISVESSTASAENYLYNEGPAYTGTSSAFLSVGTATTASTIGQDTYSHALILPERTYIEPAFASGNLAADAKLFAWGVMQNGGQVQPLAEDLGSIVSFSTRIRLDSSYSGTPLRLALVDASTDLQSIDYFRLKINAFSGGLQVTKDFTDLAEALQYFNQNLLEIGNISSAAAVDISTHIVSSSSGYFRYRFLLTDDDPFSSSSQMRLAGVPEPGSMLLVVVLFAAGMNHRRRRKPAVA